MKPTVANLLCKLILDTFDINSHQNPYEYHQIALFYTTGLPNNHPPRVTKATACGSVPSSIKVRYPAIDYSYGALVMPGAKYVLMVT